MDAILADLNVAQHTAVTTPAKVLQVLAPPGSGKTKTLTARIAWLITRCGVAPWNIIVCTFTVKAAREMQHRIEQLVGDESANRLILGTFHSVARRFLARYGQRIGLKHGFGIADTSDTKAIIKRVIKDFELTIDPTKALARISHNKARSITVEQVAGLTKTTRRDEQDFVTVYSQYQATLELSGLLDYDDLLLKCAELLHSHPQCVSNVQAVLIDEFQDTNEVQFKLMRLFAQRQLNITIVGDPDQSIYGWRNAEIENLNKMQALFPDTLVIFLEENYRSTGSILQAAQAVIEQDNSRPDKKLQATHIRGDLPVLRRLPTADAEAKWLVAELQRVQAMSGGLFGRQDFAILLRSAQLSRHIETALGNAAVPYRMVGGTKFYDRVEVKTLLDYLRVIDRPEHNDALLRVINVPTRGVGETTVKRLLDEATSKRLPMWQMILGIVQGSMRTSTKLSVQSEKGLSEFVNIILSGQKKVQSTPQAATLPVALLDLLIKRLDYEKFLQKKYVEDCALRWANVEELRAQTEDAASAMINGTARVEPESLPEVDGAAQQLGDEDQGPLSVFLANIALAGSTEQKDANGNNEQQCVTISTIHAAKGLEWPVVFIPACYDGSIPHSRAEDHDEERRLLYVGMTRAQALLYLSCPTKNSLQQEASLSTFIDHDQILHTFRKTGPELEFGQIGDLAKTLGRACPTYQDIDATRTRLLAGNVTWEDSYWPEDGTFPAEESSKWDHERDSKKGTLMPASTWHETTSKSCSQLGFMSAAAVPVAVKETQQEPKRKIEPRIAHESSKHGGNIKSFFKAPSSKSAEGMVLPTSTAKICAGGALREFNDLTNRGSLVPQSDLSLKQHAVRQAPLTATKIQYRSSAQELDSSVLVSSSPPSPKLSRDSKRMKTAGLESTESSSTTCTFVKAASTLHMTTMTVAQSHSLGCSAGPIKRTLGMGRTFKPWSARTNK